MGQAMVQAMVQASGGEHELDAELAAALLAIDPLGLKGAVVRARHGPARDVWRGLLAAFWLNGGRAIVIPRHASVDRLVGGIDVAATLARGALVEQPGLLDGLSGAIVSVSGGGELDASIAGTLSNALDKDCDQGLYDAPCFLVHDESVDDEQVVAAAPALIDRLAFFVDLSAMSHRAFASTHFTADDVRAGRRLLAEVVISDQSLAALCQASMALGIHSLRADRLAARCARASAALFGRLVVEDDDLLTAVRLVMLPRASVAPSVAPGTSEEQPHEPDRNDAEDAGDQDRSEAESADQSDSARSPLPDRLDDISVDVVAAEVLSNELLNQLAGSEIRAGSMRAAGRRTSKRFGIARGKPMGVRPVSSASGQRLNLVATLQAAAPWQRLRQRDGLQYGDEGRPAGATPAGADSGPRVIVRRQDFRMTRYRQSEGQTIVFAVDASGSTALGRLGEAKGAVELLLGQSYRRRDEVAMISFRDRTAQVLLAPTRSLVRAKRVLSSLAGGGGTPLAAGLDAAAMLASTIGRSGRLPIVVLISDGRPNIALDGRADREAARHDALRVAGRMRSVDCSSVVFDVSPRRQPFGQELANAMAGGYHHLPVLRSNAVAAAVRTLLEETMPSS